jgi:predicted secreted acid phosphatase
LAGCIINPKLGIDMFKKYFIFFFLCCSLIFVSFSSLAVEPQNLEAAKQAIIQYHDSGAYEYDIEQAVNQAYDYLQQCLEQNQNQKKLAIVFDIDQTALDFYNSMKVDDFSNRMDLILANQNKPNVPAIKPILAFYNFAQQNNVTIFFITGRADSAQTITKVELNNAGYKNWASLYMRTPKDKNRNTIDYKSSVRKKITEMGYDIVLNVGDQYNDLIGGYADRNIKLPNPFYIVP